MTTAPNQRRGLSLTIPAALASGALQSGEGSELLLYLLARELDPRGSGRVEAASVSQQGQLMFGRKQIGRVLGGPKGRRYWLVDAGWLRLIGVQRVVQSYDGEIVDARHGVSFRIEMLNTRQRRGAALFAAVVGGSDRPRSRAFIARFAGVDRKTLARWQRDPVIRAEILNRCEEWAWLEGNCPIVGTPKAR